jgi:drug/metabolite transporter (DMT)-like permease
MSVSEPSGNPSGAAHASRGPWPLAWCLLAAALFGASTPATKQFTGELHPLQIAGLLYAGAALAVGPWARASSGREAAPPTRRQRFYLWGALVFGGVIGPVLLVMGLARAPAGSVALWLNLEAVATAVLARTLFREHLGPPTWLAMGLIIVASLLLSSQGDSSLIAGGFVALACLAWGLDNNLTSLISSYTPTQITFAKGLLGAAVNLGLATWLSDAALGPHAILAVMSIGALGYGLSLVLYVMSAQQLGATRSQLIFSTAPGWGLALSWLAFGEPVLGVQVLGGALMLAALWLLERERHAHWHDHEGVVHSHRHRHDDGHHDHPHAESVSGWHAHEHAHSEESHSHPHVPDLHHRHSHRSQR